MCVCRLSFCYFQILNKTWMKRVWFKIWMEWVCKFLSIIFPDSLNYPWLYWSHPDHVNCYRLIASTDTFYHLWLYLFPFKSNCSWPLKTGVGRPRGTRSASFSGVIFGKNIFAYQGCMSFSFISNASRTQWATRKLVAKVIWYLGQLIVVIWGLRVGFVFGLGWGEGGDGAGVWCGVWCS